MLESDTAQLAGGGGIYLDRSLPIGYGFAVKLPVLPLPVEPFLVPRKEAHQAIAGQKVVE